MGETIFRTSIRDQRIWSGRPGAILEPWNSGSHLGPCLDCEDMPVYVQCLSRYMYSYRYMCGDCAVFIMPWHVLQPGHAVVRSGLAHMCLCHVVHSLMQRLSGAGTAGHARYGHMWRLALEPISCRTWPHAQVSVMSCRAST